MKVTNEIITVMTRPSHKVFEQELVDTLLVVAVEKRVKVGGIMRESESFVRMLHKMTASADLITKILNLNIVLA